MVLKADKWHAWPHGVACPGSQVVYLRSSTTTYSEMSATCEACSNVAVYIMMRKHSHVVEVRPDVSRVHAELAHTGGKVVYLYPRRSTTEQRSDIVGVLCHACKRNTTFEPSSSICSSIVCCCCHAAV